jgi:hypothetical protein
MSDLESRSVDAPSPEELEQKEKQNKKLNSRTRNKVERMVSITLAEDEPEQKEQKEKKSPLPLCYDKNMKLLTDVEDFLNNNKLFSLERYKNQRELWKSEGEMMTRFEFNDLKRMVCLYNDISEDIHSIDDGVLDKRDIDNPAGKVRSLKRLFSKYNVM